MFFASPFCKKLQTIFAESCNCILHIIAEFHCTQCKPISVIFLSFGCSRILTAASGCIALRGAKDSVLGSCQEATAPWTRVIPRREGMGRSLWLLSGQKGTPCHSVKGQAVVFSPKMRAKISTGKYAPLTLIPLPKIIEGRQNLPFLFKRCGSIHVLFKVYIYF